MMPYKSKEQADKCYRKYYLEHKDKCNEATRKSYHKHIEERRASCRVQRKNIRTEVLTYYGNGKLACVKCGYSDYRALSLDHINGGGKKAARQRNNTNLAPWLKRHGYPTGVQTLCMNCQFIKKLENKEQMIREEKSKYNISIPPKRSPPSA
jgi:hypothetical protein